MTTIKKGREIGQLYRDLKKCDPFIIVSDKPLYKPDFILFVIERLQA